MRTFKRPNEEPFQVDDSTDVGKAQCADLEANNVPEMTASNSEEPSMKWKINDIREHLSDHDVDYDRGDSKKELLARL